MISMMLRAGCITVSLVIFTAAHQSEALGVGTPVVIENEESGKWEDDPTKMFVLIPELVIGSEADEHAIFGDVYGITTDEAGDIYVLDNGFKRVQRFDSTGKYKQTIGREGRVPANSRFHQQLRWDPTKRYMSQTQEDSSFSIGRNSHIDLI